MQATRIPIGEKCIGDKRGLLFLFDLMLDIFLYKIWIVRVVEYWIILKMDLLRRKLWLNIVIFMSHRRFVFNYISLKEIFYFSILCRVLTIDEIYVYVVQYYEFFGKLSSSAILYYLDKCKIFINHFWIPIEFSKYSI